MRQVWLILLGFLARALRALADLWERVAQASERWWVAAQVGGSSDSGPPAHWLAQVERRELSAHWLDYIQERAPGLRFQRYRATAGPPAPVVRGTRLHLSGREHASHAAGAAHSWMTAVAARRIWSRPAPAFHQPTVRRVTFQEEPALQTSLPIPNKSESNKTWPFGKFLLRQWFPSAVNSTAQESRGISTIQSLAQREMLAQSETLQPENVPDPEAVATAARLSESRLSEAVRPGRWLAQMRSLLSGRALPTLRRERSRVPVRRRDMALDATEWLSIEPTAEQSSAFAGAERIASRWPSLPGEAVREPAQDERGAEVRRWPPVLTGSADERQRTAAPGEPAGVWLCSRPSPWPDLPPMVCGQKDELSASSELDPDQRISRRRRRLDDEQRGLLWNGSIY